MGDTYKYDCVRKLQTCGTDARMGQTPLLSAHEGMASQLSTAGETSKDIHRLEYRDRGRLAFGPQAGIEDFTLHGCGLEPRLLQIRMVLR